MSDLNKIESAMNCPETSCANNHALVNDNNVQNSDSDYDNNNESNVEHEQ